MIEDGAMLDEAMTEDEANTELEAEAEALIELETAELDALRELETSELEADADALIELETMLEEALALALGVTRRHGLMTTPVLKFPTKYPRWPPFINGDGGHVYRSFIQLDDATMKSN